MTWSKRPVEVIYGQNVGISVAFTWDLPQTYQRCVWLEREGYIVYAGGPAVTLMPEYLMGVAYPVVGDEPRDVADWVGHHNPDATFTSRGCIRRCSFCAVWRIEGHFRELTKWPIRPIVCDNNLLACSRAHFDKVVDGLKLVQGVDFNQGLDARLLTDYHASRLAELDLYAARIAWDHMRDEAQIMAAIERLRKAGIPKRLIRCYVLIGFDDTPEDALYRLETLRGMGIRPNPMRFQPLDAMRRNSYIAPGWSQFQLRRFMKYWSRLRFYTMPFEQFRPQH